MTTFDRPGTVAVLAVSEAGARVGNRILAHFPDSLLWMPRPYLPGSRVYSGTLQDFTGSIWDSHAAIIGVMASGILVRSIAPWVRSKHSDPAVVAVDDAARFSISLLSGHEGKANRLAETIAEITGAVPVITTGTEASRRLVVGIGCRRGVSAEQVLAAIDTALADQGRRRSEVYTLATIDLKAREPGIRQAAKELGVPVRVIPRTRIRSLQDCLREHTFAETITGVAAVCIPAAVMASPHSELLGSKTTQNGVTVALAEDTCGSWELDRADETT